jgi:hypothetical protein
MKKFILAMVAVFALSAVSFADEAATPPAGNTGAPAATTDAAKPAEAPKAAEPTKKAAKKKKAPKAKKDKGADKTQ